MKADCCIRVNWKTFLIQTVSDVIYKPILLITEHVLCLNSTAENKHTFFFSHDGESLCILFFCALYCKCRDVTVYGRYWSVFILSSVHVEYVFSQTGLFRRIGTNSSIVSSGVSPLPALTWTFITLYLFLTKWFYLFWDPQMRHICEQHM